MSNLATLIKMVVATDTPMDLEIWKLIHAPLAT